jgi:polyisoprenoid-binding protein YceI
MNPRAPTIVRTFSITVALSGLLSTLVLAPAGSAGPQNRVRSPATQPSPQNLAHPGAQEIDSAHSFATLAFISTADPQKVFTIAAAKIAGRATLDPKTPANSLVDVRLYPAGEGARLLKPDGTFDLTAANLARYTLISFRSTRASALPGGRLDLFGDLTITSVERETNVDWNTSYSGPQFGPATVDTQTREAAFATERPSSRAWPEHSLAVSSAAPQFSAVTTLSFEDFPKLRERLLASDWPRVALDEDCRIPPEAATIRDYHGVVCTGVPIDTSRPAQVPPWSVAYSGPDRERASGNRLRIALYIVLVAPGARSPAP